MVNIYPRTGRSNTVRHATHSHPLTEVNGSNGEFNCDGCKIPGSGKRYSCGVCNHVMHDYCATCPPSLTSFFMHPAHALALSVRKPATTRQNQRACDLCRESVEGIFYRCQTCDFDVHPLCTQLPQHVRHVMHPAHPLALTRCGPSACAVCFGTCESWRYRCGLCAFDIHMECVLAVCDAANTTGPRNRGVVQPPQPPNYFHGHAAPVWYGPMMGPNVYNYGYHHQTMNHVNQPARPSVPWRMFEIAGKLTMGVVSNVVFGTSSDFLMNF